MKNQHEIFCFKYKVTVGKIIYNFIHTFLLNLEIIVKLTFI